MWPQGQIPHIQVEHVHEKGQRTKGRTTQQALIKRTSCLSIHTASYLPHLCHRCLIPHPCPTHNTASQEPPRRTEDTSFCMCIPPPAWP